MNESDYCFVDKLNRKCYIRDIVVGPDGMYYQIVRVSPGMCALWDLGRTPDGNILDTPWFKAGGNFLKVLEDEKR